MTTKPKYALVDLFAGTGAFSYAGLKTGRIQPILASDIEPSSKVIYDANMGHPLTLGDIHALDTNNFPDFDILTAGFSCQSYSIAGKRLGFEDERSDVIWKVIDILKVKQPRVALMENVKGLLSHDEGKSFAVILQAVQEVGYVIKYKVLNTCVHTDVPQNRERVYIVCFKHQRDADLFIFPPELNRVKDVKHFVDENVDAKYFYDNRFTCFADIQRDMTRPYIENVIYQHRRVYTRENKSGVCPTLTANMGTGGHNVPLIKYVDGRIRKLTPRECFRFQGFCDEYVLPGSLSDARLYALAGNAVSVNLVERIYDELILVLDGDKTTPVAREERDFMDDNNDQQETRPNLASMNREMLLVECRKHELKGYSKLRKAELVAMIQNHLA